MFSNLHGPISKHFLHFPSDSFASLAVLQLDRVAIVRQLYADNFYHMTSEVLCRLEVLRPLLVADRTVVLLLPPRTPPLEAYVELLGLSELVRVEYYDPAV